MMLIHYYLMQKLKLALNFFKLVRAYVLLITFYTQKFMKIALLTKQPGK